MYQYWLFLKLLTTLPYNFSTTNHIGNVIANCARVFYAMHILLSHGMFPPTLHAIFQLTALAKLTYAASAWWGFANCRTEWSGGTPSNQIRILCPLHPNISVPICHCNSDQCHHQLQQLLPPKIKKHFSTRARPHNYQLPRETSLLDECNFMYRMLCRHILRFMH